MEYDEPGWIGLEPRNHVVFDQLLAFIDSVSADPANVQHLAKSTITALFPASDQNPSVFQYRDVSRKVFGVLLTIIKQLDSAAEQQDYLVKLVLALRQTPLPASVTQEFGPYPSALDSDMNQDLSKLLGVLTDFERDAPLHPPLEDRQGFPSGPPERPPWRLEPGRRLTGSEWANINAFLARLYAAAPDLLKVDVRGLWAMIEALEQPLPPIQLEDVLPAAACWILYAGHELKSNTFPYAYYDDDGGSRRLPWSKGELWNGQHAFNPARWDFWMRRFKDIAERSDVSGTVRSAALHAFEAGSS